MIALRSSLLRLLMVALMPFLVVTSALAATGPLCEPQPQMVETVSEMPDCGDHGDHDGQHERQAPRCTFDCPLVCGAVVPQPFATGAPLALRGPGQFTIFDTGREGLSLRPDDPPPR